MSTKRTPTPASGAAPTPAEPLATMPADVTAQAAQAAQAAADVAVTSQADAQPPAPDPTPSDHDDAALAASLDLDELVEVRVTLAFDENQPNDLIEVSARELPELEGSGHVDSHPDAVAYAKSLLA